MTRYVLIVLAFGLGVYRLIEGAWIPSSGLLMLAAGLIALKVAERRPSLRLVAYFCFAGAFVSIVVLLVQRY